jgi:glycosyltransferase involved in cell wall biosynthesis
VFKVLQICNKAPYPANDGSSIAIYNMSQGLIANGVRLHLLTINTKKHFKDDKEVPLEFKLKSHYHSVYQNTNVNSFGAFLNLFTQQSYFVSRFYFKDFEQTLIEKLKQEQFDIIQIEGLFMCVYLNTIKKYSNAKIVLRAHNIEHYIWNRHIAQEKRSLQRVYLSIQNKRLKKFELASFKSVDAIVTITEKDQDEFIKLGYKKDIYACITGVDIAFYSTKLNLPEKAKTVFYFGSMDWLPNQEAVNWFLEHCWDKVQTKIPEARLIIAGRGMPLEFFHITKPNVLIVENVENGKAFFQQHQVMIVPLWSGSGLRIKIIEGMAYGKAIVSTSIGAEGIHYTNHKNILIADNAEDFSEMVISLLQNEKLRKELETNAAAFSKEEFDNMKVVLGLISFYKTLLHG